MRDDRAILDDATRRLGETMDCDRIVTLLREIAVPALADVAFVELVDGARGDGHGSGGGAAPDDLERRARSMVRVPLVRGGDPLGTWTVAYCESGRTHDDAERALLAAIGRRASVALHQAYLLARAEDRARHAEHAARQAEEASRLKDTFLAMVSHELRTPLSSILGWTSILKKDRALVDKGVEIIERNARAQQRIVDDMLDLARIVAGKLRVDTEPVDLAGLAREVLESARPAATAKGVDLAFVAPEAGCRLAGDGARLRQIVVNLVSNATKFTPQGGSVSVALEQLGDRVVLRVTDTGRGIDPSFLPHVFERFSQGTDRGAPRVRGDGLGLGLAIVRHLVDLHGGTIGVASDGENKGATFTVTLPIKPFSAPVQKSRGSGGAAARAPAAAARPTRLAGLRVLVVEDETDSRDLIGLLLESEGAAVCGADSAEAALEALARFDADVVLSDIGMPGRDGYWLARELRRRSPATALVALTAYSTSADVSRAIAAGFVQHVGKPVDPEHLVSALMSLSGTTPTAA